MKCLTNLSIENRILVFRGAVEVKLEHNKKKPREYHTKKNKFSLFTIGTILQV